MTRLLLIRHGETKYNLNRRYCGFSNPPLNISGISQAESLAKQLKDFDVAAVYSSDLLRAVQTAEIVFPKLQIKTMPEFREFNFGIFEGLNYTEIMEKYSEFYHDWLANPLHISIPSGEGFTDFRERIDVALSSIISLHREKTIALVSHSGPIRLILCETLGYGLERFWGVDHNNAAFSIIDYPERSAPVAVDINVTLHLMTQTK